MPPITLIQLLPISFAGWGVREVVLVVALAPFGVPLEAALATSVLLGLCLIAIGLPGGLIWLTDWDIARPFTEGGEPVDVAARQAQWFVSSRRFLWSRSSAADQRSRRAAP